MYFSKLLAPTLRETPAEAEVISHQLLVRAGFIRKSSSGVYTYLPLAQKVIAKISSIIREELDQAGCQELMLPIIQPAELWLESGRWNVYGKELFRLQDRHERDFCLGPTHEEIITDLVRAEVTSYRDLPLNLYQIQNKYRDERRPRFGLMRGREFIMKDAYSFDKDEGCLAQTYQLMYEVYQRIFTRCGLVFRAVEADSGAIGGSITHEFMVIADAGEAEIVYCPECAYAANIEIASCQPSRYVSDEDPVPKSLEKIKTPGKTTIEMVSDFLSVAKQELIKTVFYQADDEVIVALVRGDRTLNEIKLQRLHPCVDLEMAAAEKIKEITGSEPGYVGPVGLDTDSVKVYADNEVKIMINAICGANEPNYHFINVQPEKDFSVTMYGDLRSVEEHEPCPSCGTALIKKRGIEVGQVFKLGTKYSEALNARYVDENGNEKLMYMGCYGIGVSRTMAAAVEQNFDRDGIIWPAAIAPFHVVIVPVDINNDRIWEVSKNIYNELKESGIEVVLDDRGERAGVKFKDADLIGYPLRVIVGKKLIEDGLVEIKARKEKSGTTIKPEEITVYIQSKLGNM